MESSKDGESKLAGSELEHAAAQDVDRGHQRLPHEARRASARGVDREVGDVAPVGGGRIPGEIVDVLNQATGGRRPVGRVGCDGLSGVAGDDDLVIRAANARVGGVQRDEEGRRRGPGRPVGDVVEYRGFEDGAGAHVGRRLRVVGLMVNGQRSVWLHQWLFLLIAVKEGR